MSLVGWLVEGAHSVYLLPDNGQLRPVFCVLFNTVTSVCIETWRPQQLSKGKLGTTSVVDKWKVTTAWSTRNFLFNNFWIFLCVFHVTKLSVAHYILCNCWIMSWKACLKSDGNFILTTTPAFTLMENESQSRFEPRTSIILSTLAVL